MEYKFNERMDEISGFGGGYEETCRNMLKAGLEWFDAHPDLAPEYQEYEGLYGLITGKNEMSASLDKAVLEVGKDCTVAMHQCVVSHLLWIRSNSWEEYAADMEQRKEGEPNA